MSKNEHANDLGRAMQMLDRAERRIAALELRLAQVETSTCEAAGVAAEVSTNRLASAPVVMMDEVSSRRGLFKVAGAVASAAVAHNLLSASPAAASTTGPYVGLNVVETTSNTTGVTVTPGAGNSVALQGTNLATAGQADGVKGVSDSVSGAGLAGSSSNGYGVFGATTSGYAVYSNGRLGLGQHLSSPGAPVTGNYDLGDIVRDNVGNIYACVTAGSAATGAAQFRKVTGPATTGQLHLLDPVRRAYDSRASQVGLTTGAAQGGQGPFVANTVRTVDLSVAFPGTGQPIVPSGATGAMIGIAVLEISGGGYATVYPTGATSNDVVHAYWGDVPNLQTIGSTVVKLNASRQFNVRTRMAGIGAQATVTVDVVGYYL